MKNEDLKRKRLILKGLLKVLESGIDTPEKVVYLLVEIRKVRELSNDKYKKQWLDFYRDWVVHAELTYNGTIIEFLDKLEDCITKGASGKSIAKNFIKNASDFFKLYILKEELEKFLSKNELPCNLTKEHKCWNKFVIILLKVVKESTIEPNKPKQPKKLKEPKELKELKEPKERVINKLSLVTDKNGYPSFKFNFNNGARSSMVKLKLR